MTRRLGPEEERLWRALTEAVAPAEQGRVRGLRPDEQRLWQAATGQAPSFPDPGREPVAKPEPGPTVAASASTVPSATPPAPRPRQPGPLGGIEPGRKRRLVRERDPIDATLDLHGMDQDRARVALERFIAWAHSQHYRAVLVITGKGPFGDGVLRRRTPEWLADASLRPMVAGVSRADQRHGGEGALYVALKRGR